MPVSRSKVTLAAPLLAAACASGVVTTRAELDAYRAAFVAAAGHAFAEELPRAAWLEATDGARVLWLGDHHRSPDLHRLHLELLDQLAARGRAPVLALEAVGTQDRPWLEAFLSGSATIDELAAAMQRRWSASWLLGDDVDSGHYRRLLGLARERRWPVVPLEPTPRGALPQRDRTIVAAVQTAAATWPDRLVVVVVGQTHLLGQGDVVARCGLPALVVGGEPTPPLRAAMAPPGATTDPTAMWRSDGSLWWFAALCR